MDYITEITVALDRGLDWENAVVSKTLSGAVDTTQPSHTPSHTPENLAETHICCRFLIGDHRGSERGHLSCSSLVSVRAMGIWNWHSPICIKVLLIALISSDE